MQDLYERILLEGVFLVSCSINSCYYFLKIIYFDVRIMVFSFLIMNDQFLDVLEMD